MPRRFWCRRSRPHRAPTRGRSPSRHGQTDSSSSGKLSYLRSTDHRVITAFIFLCTFVAFWERMGFTIAFTRTAVEMGLTETEKGTVFSSYYFGFAATQIPGGYLSKRYGGKLILALSFVFAGPVSVLTALPSASPEYIVPGVAMCRLAVGMTQGAFIPAAQSVLSHWIPPINRGTHFSIAMSGMFAGAATAMVTVPILVSLAKTLSTFYIAGGSFMTWAIVWSLVGSDMPLTSNGFRVTEFTSTVTGMASTVNASSRVSSDISGDSSSANDEEGSSSGRLPVDVWTAYGLPSPTTSFEVHNIMMTRRPNGAPLKSSICSRLPSDDNHGNVAGFRLSIPKEMKIEPLPREETASTTGALNITTDKRVQQASHCGTAISDPSGITGGGDVTDCECGTDDTTAPAGATLRMVTLPHRTMGDGRPAQTVVESYSSSSDSALSSSFDEDNNADWRHNHFKSALNSALYASTLSSAAYLPRRSAADRAIPATVNNFHPTAYSAYSLSAGARMFGAEARRPNCRNNYGVETSLADPTSGHNSGQKFLCGRASSWDCSRGIRMNGAPRCGSTMRLPRTDCRELGGRNSWPGHKFFPPERPVLDERTKKVDGVAKIMIVSGPKSSPFPWRDMLKSSAVWAVVGGNVGAGTAINVVMSWLPSYFEVFIEVDLEDMGLGAQLSPYLFMMVFSIFGGIWYSWLITKRRLSVSTSSKIVTGVAFFFAMCTLFGMGLARSRHSAVTLSSCALASAAMSRGGWSTNHVEIAAPDHAATLYSAANSISAAMSVAGLAVTGKLLDAFGGCHVPGGWTAAMGATGVLCGACGAFFVIFAQGNVVLFPGAAAVSTGTETQIDVRARAAVAAPTR